MQTIPELSWIDSTGFFTIDLGLSRMEELLERLGRPQDSLRFIHTAGSNGKGSVCAFTECALRRAGYKTGFYLSPHLIRLNERFLINGRAVSDAELIAAAEKVRVHAEVMRKAGNGPTYFELTTAIAAVLFHDAKVDYAVWETGLGGRLDATNVVTPEVSVITAISLEHTAYLGDTLAKIAAEKGGIIKPGVPLVYGPVPEEAENVLKRLAAERGCAAFSVRGIPPLCRIVNGRQSVRLSGAEYELGLPGRFQRLNAAIAECVLKVLSEKAKFSVAESMKGFADAVWPARFQIIPEKNLMIDGAHNPGAAVELAGALKEHFPGKKFHFLTGCFVDKNFAELLEILAPLAEDFVFTAFDGSGRGVRTPEELQETLRKIAPEIPCRIGSVDSVLEKLPAPDGRMTILCGSLHMCGEVLEKLGIQLFR